MSEDYFAKSLDSITHCPEVERVVLRGILKNEDVFPDVDVSLKDDDFTVDLHQTIYSVIRKFKSSGDPIETTILASYINSLTISFDDVPDVSIFDYIKDLFF